MKKMLLFFFGSFLCLSLFADDAQKKEKYDISFTGKAKAGDVYDFGIQSFRKIAYSLRVPGADTKDEAIRTENLDVVARGVLTFHKVNDSGSPLLLDFQVQSLEGSINGQYHRFPKLAGQTISADLSGITPVFKLKETAQEDPSAAILGSRNNQPDKKTVLDKEAQILLAAVFSTAGTDHLSDTLGEKATLSIGDKWNVNLKNLLKTLEDRKINASDKNIAGLATLSGREIFQNVDCWEINMKIQSKGIYGYDFRFEANILLPADPAFGGAVKIDRNATEIVNGQVTDENPLYKGTVFEMYSSDRTEIHMISHSAKKKQEDEKKSWWFDLF